MKFGMNLLLWTDHVGEEHRSLFDRLKKMGYDGVELPVFDLNVEHHKQVGRWLDEAGLQRTAVTCRTPDDNPASPDAKVRAAALDANRRAIDCCQAAGVSTLVGPYHSALGYFSGQGPTADEWKWSVDAVRQAAEHADKAGVTLAIEYLNRFECYLLNTATDAIRYVREVNHPRCRVMYDTFHSNIEEKDSAAAIRTCAPYLAHVHISENDRSTPGTGQVDWKTNFDALHAVGYDGWFTIEAFGLALPALIAATKIWRRMYESEDQLAKDGLAFMKREWSRRTGG